MCVEVRLASSHSTRRERGREPESVAGRPREVRDSGTSLCLTQAELFPRVICDGEAKTVCAVSAPESECGGGVLEAPFPHQHR